MPHADEASNFLKKFENKSITLERDFEDLDKYKRKLRYIYYENRFLNLEILESGFANAYYFSGLKYEQEILRAEDQARKLELGIWKKSTETCSTYNCIKLKELNAKNESFIIKNNCSFSCDLSGWFVKDEGRNIIYLKSLNANQEATYFSGKAKDIWNNDHDSLFIFDNKGLLVFYYKY